MNVNKVILAGRLTRDPELSTVGTKRTELCKFGLAINRSWTNEQGQRTESTCFVDCTVWGKLAGVINKHFNKGMEIYVEGHLHFDQWETQEGAKRTKLSVTVDGFQFVGSKREESEDDPPAPASQATSKPNKSRRETEEVPF